jgi:GT2 family glycosyltransferase
MLAQRRPHRQIDWGVEGFQRIAVTEVELMFGLRSLDIPPHASRLLVLVRLHGQPLGLVQLAGEGERRENACAALEEAFASVVDEHLCRDGISRFDLWSGQPSRMMPCVRIRVPAELPDATVVVATRERPERLARCLASLALLDYPTFELIVVDNDPATAATRQVVEHYGRGRIPVRYVCERRRGLGAGHNRALRDARGAVVAFTDDDVVVDRQWLKELVAPFVDHPSVAGSTGLIVPAELDTPAQLMLEAHGGFAKGFEPALYDLGANRPVDPLFPFTAGRLGSGANMAFRSNYLRDVGGFDPALGTGSPAMGGDDLAALFGVLVRGRTLAYRPAAIVWHHHHRELSAVANQAFGYGVGYGAFLTSAVWQRPGVIRWLLPRLAGGVAQARRLGGPERTASGVLHDLLPGALPPELGRLQRRGMLCGPSAYLRSRRTSARRPPAPVR